MTLGASIDLWMAHYDAFEEESPRLRALLSEDERHQATRFHFADDRLRYLVTRAMVRSVLSRYATVAPGDWSFVSNAYGRPEIAPEHKEAGTLRFNLSHTRGLIVLGITRERVLGVDVEHLGRPAALGVAERFFSPEEAAALSALAPEERPMRFYEYWTLKESYIKARGMGLSIPLERFGFEFPSPNELRLRVDPALGDDVSRWRFWQLQPADDYLLAVCAERGVGELLPPTLRRLYSLDHFDLLPLPPARATRDEI